MGKFEITFRIYPNVDNNLEKLHTSEFSFDFDRCQNNIIEVDYTD